MLGVSPPFLIIFASASASAGPKAGGPNAKPQSVTCNRQTDTHIKFILTNILIFSALAIFSQGRADKTKFGFHFLPLPHVGYVWQDLNCREFGVRTLIFSIGHESFSLICDGLLFQRNVTYLAPQIKIRYYRPVKKIQEKFGPVASISFWTTSVEGQRHSYLTPEIGIAFNRSANLTYGYNFRLVDASAQFISGHRIALRLIVF
jgi:hypothetical protein